ncbi:MAG: cobaltochelatase subunit CobN [Acidobacteriota bacterium]|nr:cobaltochelatase subunit CobN [Acidobacteriota bacterium]
MNVTVFYVGSSLLAPLKQAEREINHQYDLDLRIAAHNLGAPLSNDEWSGIEQDLRASNVVFAIHVMDGENATRIIAAFGEPAQCTRTIIAINCMPNLMRQTRMGQLDMERLFGGRGEGNEGRDEQTKRTTNKSLKLFTSAASWVGRQTRGSKLSGKRNGYNGHKGHGQYLKLVDRLPAVLRFIPGAGKLRDIKNYLNIFCYFLQPTPTNIRSMILYALREYVPDSRLEKANTNIPAPEHLPSLAIYHPDAPKLFETFEEYGKWYVAKRGPKSNVQRPTSADVPVPLDAESTIGLLLMRPQVVSKTTRHYDALIRAIEAEGLSVIPALSTLMDNREAVSKFFVDDKSQVSSLKSQVPKKRQDQRPKSKVQTTDHGPLTKDHSRVSQIVSLTGFSFVGGPAMNDSEAASEFLQSLNRPYRSAVSLDMQTIDVWRSSQTGLNPVQAGMQIAIPEIDGATEPFIYGGLPASGVEPVALEDCCARLARRLKLWNRLRTAPRNELKLALILFCFPPNKGNIGTAADLDVFPSVWDTLQKLQTEGYYVDLPASPEALRDMLLGGNADSFAATANVAYRMTTDEYRRLCPYANEIEDEWGIAPGGVNSFGRDLLIQGVQLGNIFVGVQPTFGYEGDPMRLMMARSGAPHHGFMAFYTYLSQLLNVDAVVHVGTHGSLEFMPGKQVGLSGECWPDRLIGELPNISIYSVNNPSEGSIAKRRSYAELISYLTPPIENAGLYKDLATLKDMITSYRQSANDEERVRLFESIEAVSGELNFVLAGVPNPDAAFKSFVAPS